MNSVRYLAFLLLLGLCPAVFAGKPVVAIIIDDLGYRPEADSRALTLPRPVAFAVLPHTPFARRVIDVASGQGNELVLHLPMESSRRDSLMAPGTLTSNMDWTTFVRTLQSNIASVPGLVAINNHEGSVLTSDNQRMQWLMEELSRHPGIAFIDSRTTHHTVAQKVAVEHGLPTTRRDVFLDYEPGKIAEQFELMMHKAIKEGSALAIAHPHPETIHFLLANINRLAENGIELVPVRRLIEIRNHT